MAPKDGSTGPDDPDDHGPPTTGNEVALTLFEYRLAELRASETQRVGRRNLWLAHHWPADYHDRCALIGGRRVCRRCGALYPLGFLVALVSAAGYAPWPASIDPWPIWALSIPATIAYVGEALGWFRYHVRWQVGTTLAAALAFGRALGYELIERWHPWFWGPIALFGAIWLSATVVALRRGGDHEDDQMVAMASSSSSSVL